MQHRKTLKFEAKNILDGKGTSLGNLTRHFLLLHPTTIKKIEGLKGCNVFLYSGNSQLLFRYWPCISVPQDSIVIPSYSYFRHHLTNSPFCLELYSSPVDSAHIIILSCDKEQPYMKSKDFEKYLRTHFDQFYLAEGTVLHLPYLGQQLSFTIAEITSPLTSTDEKSKLDDICSDLSLLDISRDNVESSSQAPIMFSTPISKNPKSILDESFGFELNCGQVSKKFYRVGEDSRFKVKSSKSDTKICSPCFEDLVGLEEQISFVKTVIDSLLVDDFSKNSGMIFIGPSGTGKTYLAEAIQNEYQLPVYNLKYCNITSNDTELKSELKNLFKEAICNSPSFLFFDDMDSIFKIISRSKRGWLVPFLSTLICNALNSKEKVIFIGAVQKIAEIDSCLRKPGCLEKELHFKVPSVAERNYILGKILCNTGHNLDQEQISEIANLTHGFTGGDLQELCDKAFLLRLKSLDTTDYTVTFEDLRVIAKSMIPSSIAEFRLEKPNVKWSEIGGMQDVKNAIIEMVEWPLTLAEQFKKFKITPARGILLYGPPGCSKTMIAKALACESNLNFISIKGPQLFNKYVGESENAVSELFKKARSAAPCVIFFDEIDSLASIRGSTSGNSNVAERILTQLLIEIDGIDVLKGGVSIIAATNRPDMIDPSLLRPGRFDQMIYVPLPDTATREEILQVKLRSMPISADVDLSYLVQETEGYTGAEITDLCREAGMLAINDYIAASVKVVPMKHFLSALESVKPRTSKAKIEFYETYSKRKSRSF